MANDDAPPQPPKPAGNAQRRGRPPKSRGDQESSQEAAPSEDAAPEAAVATAEPEGADAVAEVRPEGVGPVPPPSADAERNRLDLAALKEMSITKLAQVAKGLEIPGAATMKKQELVFQILRAQAEKEGLIFSEGGLEILPDGLGFPPAPEYCYLPGPDEH